MQKKKVGGHSRVIASSTVRGALTSRVLRLWSALLPILLISSCVGEDLGCTSCKAPSEARSEMALQGATLTALTDPVPENVNQRQITGDYGVADVTMYFAPSSDQLITNDFAGATLTRFPYEFTFSTLANGNYTVIEGVQTLSVLQSDQPAYYGGLAIDVGPQDLLLEGNHLLSGMNSTLIPLSATHVELWFRTSEEQPRELVRRIPLLSLYAWQRYFKPFTYQTNLDE